MNVQPPSFGGYSPTPPPPPPPPVAPRHSHPLQIEGRLDVAPSRWLWLVKWVLLIPHYVVLAVLAPVSLVLTGVAWFAILITGRYPRAIFDFNVGVLRWWWRVGFYGYSALGTDSYPPFTLGETPDYPATFSVAYPEHLSRGLVFVKWLLAVPHLVIVGILVGGGTMAVHNSAYTWNAPFSGLISLLVLVGGVILLFTASYPRSIFELVMGLNRWVFRVLVYVFLMRDEYPPFRLDSGDREPEDGPLPMAPPSLSPRAAHGM